MSQPMRQDSPVPRYTVWAVVAATVGVLLYLLVGGESGESGDQGKTSAINGCLTAVEAAREYGEQTRSFASYTGALGDAEKDLGRAARLNTKYKPLARALAQLRDDPLIEGAGKAGLGVLVNECG